MKLYTRVDGRRPRYIVADDHEVLEYARSIAAAQFARGKAIRQPSEGRDTLIAALSSYRSEVFAALFLDNRHRVIEFKVLFQGTIDNTTIYPREVVREAIRTNAAALILAHNHPSGIAEPSESDQLITRRLRSALELIDVRVLDHFIVGDGNATSLASRGMF